MSTAQKETMSKIQLKSSNFPLNLLSRVRYIIRWDKELSCHFRHFCFGLHSSAAVSLTQWGAPPWSISRTWLERSWRKSPRSSRWNLSVDCVEPLSLGSCWIICSPPPPTSSSQLFIFLKASALSYCHFLQVCWWCKSWSSAMDSAMEDFTQWPTLSCWGSGAVVTPPQSSTRCTSCLVLAPCAPL